MKKSISKAAVSLVALSMLLGACSNSDSGSNSSSNSDGGESSYPTKPINIIVPAGAGGDTDRNTRITAEYLAEELDGNLVVTNVNGSGGTVGAQQVIDADPDGYTALSFHNSTIINSLLELADFGYEDYQLAGSAITDLSNSFIVSADSEFTDLQSLIDAAKEKPGEITIATETGAFTHLQLLAFQNLTDTEFKIVDVGSAAEKTTALLGGQIDIIPTQLGLVQEYIESGDFRSLGVMSEERLAGAPDVPTFVEQGVDLKFDKFFYWAFPKDTPQEVVDKFSEALENVTNNPEFQKEIEPHLLDTNYLSPDDLSAHFEKTTEEYKALLDAAQ
ncbi:tripartite tricarboxylate transporter substrate binding protein [Ureibacillus sp. GCM10028918]|uniref:tripartite tricarboxylate transporter substrate binding protein n=1 Tax=Ureibacillus sp. GCM10028918 TaxID=3273429 RepID=UPI00361492A7